MAQAQNNVERFAGPSLIQETDHCSEIPQAQDGKSQPARQAQQGQSAGRQQGGNRTQGEFYYESPRQVH